MITDVKHAIVNEKTAVDSIIMDRLNENGNKQPPISTVFALFLR
jgi:hypothetical protein